MHTRDSLKWNGLDLCHGSRVFGSIEPGREISPGGSACPPAAFPTSQPHASSGCRSGHGACTAKHEARGVFGARVK